MQTGLKTVQGEILIIQSIIKLNNSNSKYFKIQVKMHTAEQLIKGLYQDVLTAAKINSFQFLILSW